MNLPKNPTVKTLGIGLLIVRVSFGVLMMIHGVQKLPDVPGTIAAVAGMGWPAPELFAWLTIAGEIGLGFCLVLGVFVRIAGAFTALLFAAIWLTTSLGKPLFTDAPGVTGELALVYFVLGFAFMFIGAGHIRADRVLVKEDPLIEASEVREQELIRS
ncbi:DoxX family protein [Haematomicrobium sanguinis]|uniref:DoxX family protein n=1 Tax=Haematomicrobium sanguinis TaxID=479106 RepID=UPI00047B0E04|nr:DoxX family protein [Haematomicrobium sanguinis]